MGFKIFFAIILISFATILEVISISALFPLITLSFEQSVPFQNSSNSIIKTLFSWYYSVLLNFEYLSVSPIILSIVLITLLFILKAFILYFSYRMIGGLRRILVIEIRNKIFKNLSIIPFSEFKLNGIGKYNLLTTELPDRVSQNFQFKIYSVASAIQGVVLLTPILIFSPLFLITMIFFGVLAYLLLARIDNRVKVYSKKYVKEKNKFSDMVSTDLNNYKYLVLTNQTDFFHIRGRQLIEKLGNFQLVMWSAAAAAKSLREPIALSVIFLSSICYYYYGGNMQFLIIMLVMVYRSVSAFLSSHHYLNASFEHDAAVDEIMPYFAEIVENDTQRATIDKIEELAFRDVKFGFDESQKPIVDGASFQIKHGEFVVLRGQSGSGKTTTIDLLLGLFNPLEGEVLINNNNINEIGISSLRSKVGILVQEPVLTDGGLYENIFMGATANKQEQLRAVCYLKKLNLHGFDLAPGASTKNLKLSGGQKQRVALIRELMRNPQLLVLDEPTSALDFKNTQAVLDCLLDLKGKVTIIIITHSEHFNEYATKIVEVEEANGR